MHKKKLNNSGLPRMMVRARKTVLTPGRMIRPLLVVCAMFYLCYHSMHGERGLYALIREQRERAALRSELVETKAEREKVELRVTHLRDGSLDLDLLDEQMRRMLGVMKKGEVIILNDPRS